MSSTLQCDKCHKIQKNENEEWGRASMLGCGTGKFTKIDLCKKCSDDFTGVLADFLTDKK